tara:strand:+ start:33 stop:278 length:246 start_codon:yes stop_codon:yes gene_type:complete
MIEGHLTSRSFIKNSYAQLLLYYYKKGVGEVSEIAGATITDNMIDTIERRYKQLGGDPVILKLRNYRPSINGELKKKEPKR